MIFLEKYFVQYLFKIYFGIFIVQKIWIRMLFRGEGEFTFVLS